MILIKFSAKVPSEQTTQGPDDNYPAAKTLPGNAYTRPIQIPPATNLPVNLAIHQENGKRIEKNIKRFGKTETRANNMNCETPTRKNRQIERPG